MRQHNSPHLVENEEALKTLRAGYIQSGHGIADIRAPEQKAITEQEHFQAYRHNPGDLHLSLQNIRQKYLDNPTKKDLFLAFAAASKTQVLEKASGKTVWDWLCEDDLLADAKQCLEHIAQTGNEMAITRHYDTGEWHTTSFGDEKSVDIDLPDAPHTSIHCHPNGLNTPSPADLLILNQQNTQNASIVANDGGKMLLSRFKAAQTTQAQNAINDFIIKWQPIIKTTGKLSYEQYEEYLEDFKTLQNKGFINEEKLNG